MSYTPSEITLFVGCIEYSAVIYPVMDWKDQCSDPANVENFGTSSPPTVLQPHAP